MVRRRRPCQPVGQANARRSPSLSVRYYLCGMGDCGPDAAFVRPVAPQELAILAAQYAVSDGDNGCLRTLAEGRTSLSRRQRSATFEFDIEASMGVRSVVGPDSEFLVSYITLSCSTISS